MAEEPEQNAVEGENEAEANESKSPGRLAFLTRLLSLKWISIIVGVTILIQGAVFACYQFSKGSSSIVPSREVSLGDFRFEAGREESGRITKAEFNLHIALLEHVDRDARARLGARKFRVQQDVEELLRKAHGGDFDDPNLGELKRQLQEQINDTLGLRAIADVIITDLQLLFNADFADSTPENANGVPWIEQPEELTSTTSP